MRYCFTFLTICLLYFSCSPKPKEDKAQDVTPAIPAHLLNQLLDDEGPDEILFPDSLETSTIIDIKSAIAYTKYNLYRKAVPQQGPSPEDARVGMVFDEDLFVFTNESYVDLADSLVNAIEDSLYARKILLIDRLLRRALFMYDTTNYGHNEIVDGKPIKSGIKYAWGAKTPSGLYNPFEQTAGSEKPSSCNYNITGLDCSGFIYQLFTQSKIKLPARKAEHLRRSDTLKKYLNPYFSFSDKFTVQDFPKLRVDKIEAGDLLYFYTTDSLNIKTAYHIGIALPSFNGLKFFHSSGGRNKCNDNISETGGIRCQTISGYLEGKKKYGVVRIIMAK